VAVLTFKPLVFVSSCITTLREERDRTRVAIEATGLARTWLFEFHGAASGDPPEAQYLARARSCDLFVLLIADSLSPATWQEYEEAFQDNAVKVLPFLVGRSTDATEEARATLRGRHTYQELASVDDIPAAVAHAVENAVSSGALLVGPLHGLLRESVGRLRRVLDLPADLEFPSLVLDHSGTARAIGEGIEGARPAVLTGPAGSGKTYTALRALADGRDPYALPLNVRIAGDSSSLWQLIAAVLESVRFQADEELLRQWCQDGRLAIVFDGIDEVGDAARFDAVKAIERFCDEYPRCRVLVTIRYLASESLPSFVRLEMAPLPDEALVELFSAVGYEIDGIWELPDRLRALVRRPLWAGLLARAGLQARTALKLLEAAIGHRVDTALPNEAVAATAVRRALGVVAVEDQVNPAPHAAACIDSIARWLSQPATAIKYQPQPAEWYLQQIAKTGLAAFEAGRLVFGHPLLSACLAAEEVVENGGLMAPATLSSDARVFVAVMLPEARPEELNLVLESCDIFALASVSRLAEPHQRRTLIGDDISRFDHTLAQLAMKAGRTAGSRVPLERTTVYRSGDFVAMRRVAAGARDIANTDDLTAWATPGQDAVAYTCWTSSPFSTEMPELLAAAEIVAMFKARMTELRPNGSQWAPFGSDGRNLLSDKSDLEHRLIRFVKEVRDCRLEFLAELGLLAHPLAMGLEGEPAIKVFAGGSDEPRFDVEWGCNEGVVDYAAEDVDHRGHSLSTVLSDAPASAWYELSKDLERFLDSDLTSQSPTRPSRFPEWII
jgi:hypothetical protein